MDYVREDDAARVAAEEVLWSGRQASECHRLAIVRDKIMDASGIFGR